MSLNLHCCHTTMQTWIHNTEVCVPDITIQQKFIQFSHINELMQMRYLKANNDMLFQSNFAEWKITSHGEIINYYLISSDVHPLSQFVHPLYSECHLGV